MGMSPTTMWVTIGVVAGFLALSALARFRYRDPMDGVVFPPVSGRVHAPGIGDIRLTEPLGKGRFSWVMKGEFAGSQYAVKFRKTDVGMTQIEREVEVLSALADKEGFPRVYSIDPEKKFFVMEFLQGYTSLDKVSDIPLSVGEVTTELITRLEEVHAAGFVYGDIHKRNIFINLADRSAPIKVSDFALSSRTDSNKSPQILNIYLGSIAEQERRPLRPIDDIQRLAYVLLDFFYKGGLPWIDTYTYRETQVENTNTAIADYMILNAKKHLPDNKTYIGHVGMEKGFKAMLKYVKDHDRNESIDYDALRGMFGRE